MRGLIIVGVAVVGLLAAITGLLLGSKTESNPTTEITLIAIHPHDRTFFVQGYEFLPDGNLLESTGYWNESTLRVVDPLTAETLQLAPLDDKLFAEGATEVDGAVWQLTWHAGLALRYPNFELIGVKEPESFTYQGQGWGLCYDEANQRLVMSDGTPKLTLRSAEDFSPTGSIEVTGESGPIAGLNELECVGDLIWANIYQSNHIVAIDSKSGQLVTKVELASLVPEEFKNDPENVLNGIAFNPDSGHFWVTGKRWPIAYELDFGQSR